MRMLTNLVGLWANHANEATYLLNQQSPLSPKNFLSLLCRYGTMRSTRTGGVSWESLTRRHCLVGTPLAVHPGTCAMKGCDE